jgi:hypothetical protein
MSEEVVTPEVQAVPEFESQADFVRWRSTGELPQAEAKTESSEASEEEAKPLESETSKQEGDEEPQPDELTKKGLAKRFSKLTQARREAEARAAAAEARLAELQGSRPAQEDAKPVIAGEPKLDDFDTFEQYTRALARWEARQLIESERKAEADRTEKKRVESTIQNWNQRVAEFSSKYEDYGDLVDSLPPLPNVLQRAVIESEAGPELAYHLAKPENHEQLERLISASDDAMKMARIIGRIEAQLVKPPEPKKEASVSKAPDPIKPVGGKSLAAEKSPDEMTYQEFKSWREKQIKQRR